MSSLDVLDVDYLKKELLWQIKADIEKNPRDPARLANPYTDYGLTCAAEEEFERLIELGFVGMPYLEDERFPGVGGMQGITGMVGSQGTTGIQGLTGVQAVGPSGSSSSWSSSGTGAPVRGSGIGSVLTTSTAGTGYLVYGGGTSIDTATTVKTADGSWKVL